MLNRHLKPGEKIINSHVCPDEWGYAGKRQHLEFFHSPAIHYVSRAWRKVHASNELASGRTVFPNNINKWQIAICTPPN